MWRNSCPYISIVSTSKYCIHLQVNTNSPATWFFSIVYASPRPFQRLDVWKELIDFNTSIFGPWCLAGDFNQAIFDWEKQGGGPINAAARDAFKECIDSY